MGIDVIIAKTPYVIPAIPERVCDVIVIPSLNLQHQIVDGQMRLGLTLEAYQAAFDQHGPILAPIPIAHITEPDMYTASETNQFAENLVNAAVAYARDQLIKLGKLDGPESSEEPPTGES